MSKSSSSGLGAKIRAHKVVSIIIFILIACGLAAGGWYGWQQYLYRQSSAYAVEQLRSALTPPQPATLAHLVDFNSLGHDMAKAGQESFPFFLEGGEQERGISHVLQSALLKKFLDPEPKGSQFPEEQTEQAKLEKPLEILPPDFIAQFLATMNARNTSDGGALITAKIEHPQLNQTFPIALAMQRTAQGWQIRHLVNAKDLAEQLKSAMLARHAALRNVFVEKNAATTKLMDTYLPVQACSANAGMLSDGKTVILIIHALARNKGEVQVNNFNLDTTIRGRSGQVLLHRFLNAAKPVGPGEDFNHRWSMELERTSPLAQALLQDGPLQCSGRWQTLSLNNGRVLHIVDEPNPDRNCEQPGHNHPEGFCALPVFQR